MDGTTLMGGGSELVPENGLALSLHDAVSDLEQALAAPSETAPDSWQDQIVQTVDRIRGRIREHASATEGHEGFHAEIRAAEPRLAHAVDQLADEHVDLDELLVQLREEASATQPADADHIRDLGYRVVSRFAKHVERGASLMHEAFDRDLGGGD